MAGRLFFQGKVAEAVSLVLERKKQVKELEAVTISQADMRQIMTVLLSFLGIML